MNMLKEAPAINLQVLRANHTVAFVVAPECLLKPLDKNVVYIVSCLKRWGKNYIAVAVLGVGP